MKEEKVGLTTTSWILSISGIVLLSLLIILPPIFRVVFKETEQEIEKQYITTGTLICQKDAITNTNYNDNEVLIIKYKNNNIESYTVRTERKYLDPNIYGIDKVTYGRYTTSFNEVNGYKYTTNFNDDTSTVIISSDYDMKTFLPTTVTIETITEPVAIVNHYLLGDNLEITNNNLTTNGYACEKNNEQVVEVE